MEIVKLDIKWNGTLRPLSKVMIDGIAVHHMVHPTADVYEVDRWHKAKGWVGIGYGYWISKAGVIYEARGTNQNAGVADENEHLISIGFQGDYENFDTEMPALQFDAGVWLIKHLKEKIPSIVTVGGHGKWNATSCPGKFFPLKEMIDRATTVNYEHWAEKYFKYLNDNGVLVQERRFDDKATRGDLFAMLARMKGYKEV